MEASWREDSSNKDESREASEASLWSDWLEGLRGVWARSDSEQDAECCRERRDFNILREEKKGASEDWVGRQNR